MKKVFKIIAALGGLLLVVLLATVLIVPMVFNPNDHRGEIEQQVKDATGRELKINDDIALTLFPWIGISLGEVTLGNAPGFDEVSFARIERAEVKLRLMPLLSQRIEASTVILHGLRLNLAIAKDGATNWDDLVGEPSPASDASAATADSAASDATAPSSPELGLAALAIGGLHIEDAEVNYDDRAGDVRYAVKQLSLKTGPVSLNAPLDVAFSSQFESSEPQMNGQLALTSRVQFDPGNERYSFKATTLDATVRGSDLPQGQAVVKFGADIDLDMKQQTAALSAFKLTSYGLALSGAFDARQILGDVTFDGDLIVSEFNPKTVMQTFEIEPPATADPAAMTRMQLAMAIDGTLQQYNLQKLQIMLDETLIAGEAQLVMSDAPVPAVKYALTVDQIDADRYLPPVVEETEEAAAVEPAPIATPASGAGAAASTLPLEMLRELNVNGTFDIDKFKLSGLNLSDIKTKVAAKAGVIRLHPITANLYQGQYQGDIKLDAQGDVLKLALDEAMKQIHVGPLLKDYMGDDKVRGVGTILAKLTASGETPEAITKTLNGTASIAFVDGAVKDVNIVQMVREAQAKIKGETLPPGSNEQKDTDFAEMKASFNITDGLVKNNDLSVKSPFVRVGGEGEVNLVTETIDYLVKAVITKSEQGQGGAELDALRGLTIPVRVTGTFSEPKFKPELGSLLKSQAKQALEEEKAKLKAELQQKLEGEKARVKQEAEDKMKEKLKGLFGR